MEHFDKEFVMYLSKYIGQNNKNAKKYLNAYFMKFKDIKKDQFESESKKIISEAYRFWDFEDKECLEFIFGKKIKISKSGFLSYFSNIGNTKYMIDFLELDYNKKIFYLIEKNRGEFLNIYVPLNYINNDEYSDEDLTYINEVLKRYSKENEYVKLENDEYYLNYNNIKSILIHEWLGDLLEIDGMHKLSNGYYYLLVTPENIEKLRKTEEIEYLVDNYHLINSKGCSLLDEFYDETYDNYMKELEKENKEEEEVDDSPVPIKFKVKD